MKTTNNSFFTSNNNINKNVKTIAIGSGKGGVGKSTIAANLAYSLSQLNKNVGLIDADIYGPTQSKIFGCNEKITTLSKENKILPLKAYGVEFISINSIIPHNKSLILRAPIAINLIKEFLNNVNWNKLDYLLIDLPPGTGDIQLTILQNAKLDGAIIITTPQELSIDIAKKGLDMFKKLNVPILGIIKNMSSYKCDFCHKNNFIFNSGNINKLTNKNSTSIICNIPINKKISESCDNGILITNKIDSEINNLFIHTANYCIKKLSDLTKNYPDSFELKNGALHIIWISKKINTILNPYKIRLSCKCAICIDEKTNKSKVNIKNIPLNITITNIETIGNYGLKITFSDNHNSGIFTFNNLIKLTS